MQWIELTIKTASPGIELVGARLTALGYDSFIMDDQVDFHDFLEQNQQYWGDVDAELAARMENISQIRLYITDSPEAPQTVCFLREHLASLPLQFPNLDFGPLRIDCAGCKDEDWENSWKQYYKPLPIGKKLLVVPKWLTPENPEHRIPVLLDPGMIFGTGTHASTRMCMMALEEAVHGGERVIDLGSGSGILSFAALLLGAKTAVGVDIDPKAEGIARENAGLNGLGGDRFLAVTANVLEDSARLEELAEGGYDIVLLNIVADVIIPLAPVAAQFLRPGGVLICSGILDVRLPEVQAALEAAGFHVLADCTLEGWYQLTAAL